MKKHSPIGKVSKKQNTHNFRSENCDVIIKLSILSIGAS